MPKEEPAEAKTADESSEATQLQALARQFTPALRRFFGKRASQPADVDDLIQEVFTRLANLRRICYGPPATSGVTLCAAAKRTPTRSTMSITMSTMRMKTTRPSASYRLGSRSNTS